MSQFCISCGVENPDEAKFCKICGQKLKTDEAEKAEQEERAKEAQRKKEEKEAAEKVKYETIGGWLAFFGFILVIGNISWLAYIVKTYGGNEFATTIESLYMQGYTETVSYLNMLVAVELVEYFFLLLLTINFFMKSPITRALMIVYSIVMIAGVPISIALLYKINPDMSQYTSEISKMIGSSFWVIVWLLYFIFSKRVKKTFVAKDGNEPENSLMFTIVFALLIPGYFGYKYYSVISSLTQSEKNIINNDLTNFNTTNKQKSNQYSIVHTQEIDKDKFALTILTKPANARIRIMNIQEKYSDGIVLSKNKEGSNWESKSYKVRVDKNGYIPRTIDVSFPYSATENSLQLSVKLYPKQKIELNSQKVVLLHNLMWQDNVDSRFVKKNWRDAKEYCFNLSLKGYYNWRLPTINELGSIKSSQGYSDPSIKKEFQNARSSYYWSSTSRDSWSASTTPFQYNTVDSYGYSKKSKLYIRCVRDN